MNNKVKSAPPGLLRCALCAEKGKDMFFATKHDLGLHVKAKHKLPEKEERENIELVYRSLVEFCQAIGVCHEDYIVHDAGLPLSTVRICLKKLEEIGKAAALPIDYWKLKGG